MNKRRFYAFYIMLIICISSAFVSYADRSDIIELSDKTYCPTTTYIIGWDSEDEEIEKYSIGNPDVLKCKLKYGQLFLYPKKAGKSHLEYVDNYGNKTSATVVVKESWFKRILKQSSLIYVCKKKAYIEGYPGTKVTLKIKGKTYKTKLKSNHRTIKLKKKYKTNTKFKVTYSYNSSKKTHKYVQKGKTVPYILE